MPKSVFKLQSCRALTLALAGFLVISNKAAEKRREKDKDRREWKREREREREREQTEPVAVEVDGNERRRDSKVVDQRKQLDKERQLLRRCYELYSNNAKLIFSITLRLLSPQYSKLSHFGKPRSCT